MTTITTPEELDALPDGTLIEATGDYLNGQGTFTRCWARPLPEFVTGGGERLWEVLVYGTPATLTLTHARLIQSATVLYRPDLPQNRPENTTGGEKATRVGSDGEGGLKSAPAESWPIDEDMKISNGWLVETGHEGNFIPGYGMEPGSDAMPLVKLSDIPGYPDEEEIARTAFASIDVDELARVVFEAGAGQAAIEFGLDGPVLWSSLDADDVERMRVQARAVKSWLMGGAV